MGTVTISETLIDKLMTDKHKYDVICQAFKLAKAEELDGNQLKPLTMAKQKYKKVCAQNTHDLLRSMPLNTNVINMRDNWHAVRYVDTKGNIHLITDLLKPDEVYLIKRDGRNERELSRNDYENLVPAMRDDDALEAYKLQLQADAWVLLGEELGIDVPDALYEDEQQLEESIEEAELPEEDKPITASLHALLRWIQRIIGVTNEAKAEMYRRNNHDEVNEAVLDGFGTAEKVWEDDDGITYWFDPNNVMYVVGRDSIIITLYEVSFGFSKAINRMIVFEQLAVLKAAKDALEYQATDSARIASDAESEVQAINDQIALLEAKIAEMVSKRAVEMAQRDEAHKLVNTSRAKYTAEFNKLFKKWDN